MTSEDRVLTALDHREPDRVPIDFGASAVTGIHVSCVAALRRWFGLDPLPVKVHEPYQMLGLIKEDLAAALGLDVASVTPRKSMFGFPNENWKPWRMYDGLEVLVPGGFQITVDASGDILIYPEGGLTAPPGGRTPKDGYFFDSIIRQEPVDLEHWNIEDNLEEFTPVSQEDLDHFARSAAAERATGRAVMATFGGTALGDIALVPGPWMKHPKGIRDVAEWYMATSARRDAVDRIFSRQIDIALENLRRIAARERQRGCDVPLRHRLRHADEFLLRGAQLPRVVAAALQAHLRLDQGQHELEDLQAFLRLGGAVHRFLH